MENKFEKMMRICMLDRIIVYLSPTIFSKNHLDNPRYWMKQKDDLFGLMRSNKNIYRMMEVRMIQHIEFKASDIMHWNEKKLSYVHRLHISGYINNLLVELLNVTKNLKCLHIDQFYFRSYNRDQISESLKIPLKLKCLSLDTDIFSPVTHMTFPGSFGPNGSLTQLSFGNRFKFLNCLENILPDSLTYLSFGSWNYELKKNILPKNLTHLSFTHFDFQLDPGVLPTNLTHLSFGLYNHRIKNNIFPAGLKYLLFNQFNCLLETDSLPQNLQTLHFKNYNLPLNPGVLPSNLTSLSFRSDDDYLSEYNNPNGFNQRLKPHVLPESLLELSMGNNFTETLDLGVLPKNLTMLSTGHRWNHHIPKNILPSTLRIIQFGNNYNQSLAQCAIGIKSIPNLEQIQISDDYKYKNKLINMVNKATSITYLKKNNYLRYS